jgi:hypothetical protein
VKSGLGMPAAGLAQSNLLRILNLAEGSAHQSKYSTKVELLAIGFWMGVRLDSRRTHPWMEPAAWSPSQAMVKLPFTVDQGGDPLNRSRSLGD